MPGCSPAVPQTASPRPAWSGTICSQISSTGCLQRVAKQFQRAQLLLEVKIAGTIFRSFSAHTQLVADGGFFHDVVANFRTFTFTANGETGVTNDIYQTGHSTSTLVNPV